MPPEKTALGRASPDDIAALAEKKALAAIGGADLVLVAVDATAPAFGGIDEILRLAAAPVVAAVTKCDLAPPDRCLSTWRRSAWVDAIQNVGGATAACPARVRSEGTGGPVASGTVKRTI